MGRPRLIRARGNDEIGAATLFRIRNLEAKNRVEPVFGHSRAPEDPCTLDMRWSRYHRNDIDRTLADGFQQHRHVNDPKRPDTGVAENRKAEVEGQGGAEGGGP